MTRRQPWVRLAIGLIAAAAALSCSPVSSMVLARVPGGPAPQAGSLPFQTVAQGAVQGSGPPGPAINVVSQLADVAALAGLLAPAGQAALAQVDFGASVALVAVAGVKPTSGYSITVQGVSVDAGGWRVVVSQAGPPPAAIVLQVLTGPYHVVVVPRSALGGPATSAARLEEAAGQVLATATPAALPGSPASAGAGSAADGGLPFETLAQAAPERAEPGAPAVFAILRPEDVAQLATLVEEGDQQRLSGLDYSQVVALAVLAGVKPTDGFAVVVQQVQVVNGAWRITAELRGPDPVSPRLTTLTSPYQLVQVPRVALGEEPPRAWVLVDPAGTVLAVRSAP